MRKAGRAAIAAVTLTSVVSGCTLFQGASVDSMPARQETRAVPIYPFDLRDLVTRDHTFGGADPGFGAVYVLDSAAAKAGDPDAIRPRPGRPFSDELKAELAAELDGLPPVTFVATRAAAFDGVSPGRVKNHGALVTLGPVAGGRRRVEVGANLWIDGKAATWLTYVVRKSGDTWRVTGITGPVAIA